MNSSSLLALLQLSDLTLPIGGFSHSSGLETYVQYGLVKDRETAIAYISAQLAQNIFHTDAAFVSLAYDAAACNDETSLLQLDEECTAVKLPREMRQMSQKLGLRLLKLFSPLHQNDLCEHYKDFIERREAAGHYAIVFGLYGRLMGITKQEVLTAFFYNAAAGMVTNCVKLVPLGQLDGQAMLFSLHDLLDDLSSRSMVPDKALIGLCCTGFDIRCMQHEQLYSRLYMS